MDRSQRVSNAKQASTSKIAGFALFSMGTWCMPGNARPLATRSSKGNASHPCAGWQRLEVRSNRAVLTHNGILESEVDSQPHKLAQDGSSPSDALARSTRANWTDACRDDGKSGNEGMKQSVYGPSASQLLHDMKVTEVDINNEQIHELSTAMFNAAAEWLKTNKSNGITGADIACAVFELIHNLQRGVAREE